MDKTKGGGIGEPKFAVDVANKSHNGGGVKSDNLNKLVTEKLKNLILEWSKAEKARSSINAQSHLSKFTKLVIAAIGMVLCAAVLLEFTAVSDTMSSRLTLRSSHSVFFGPPESKFAIYTSFGSFYFANSENEPILQLTY